MFSNLGFGSSVNIGVDALTDKLDEFRREAAVELEDVEDIFLDDLGIRERQSADDEDRYISKASYDSYVIQHSPSDEILRNANSPIERRTSSFGQLMALEPNDYVMAPRATGLFERAVVLEVFDNTANVQFIRDQSISQISKREIDFISHLRFFPKISMDGVAGMTAQAFIPLPPTPEPVEKPWSLPTVPPKPSVESQVTPGQYKMMLNYPPPQQSRGSPKTDTISPIGGSHWYSSLYANDFYRYVRPSTIPEEEQAPVPIPADEYCTPALPIVRRCVVSLNGTERTWDGAQLSHWLTEPYQMGGLAHQTLLEMGG